METESKIEVTEVLENPEVERGPKTDGTADSLTMGIAPLIDSPKELECPERDGKIPNETSKPDLESNQASSFLATQQLIPTGAETALSGNPGEVILNVHPTIDEEVDASPNDSTDVDAGTEESTNQKVQNITELISGLVEPNGLSSGRKLINSNTSGVATKEDPDVAIEKSQPTDESKIDPQVGSKKAAENRRKASEYLSAAGTSKYMCLTEMSDEEIRKTKAVVKFFANPQKSLDCFPYITHERHPNCRLSWNEITSLANRLPPDARADFKFLVHNCGVDPAVATREFVGDSSLEKLKMADEFTLLSEFKHIHPAHPLCKHTLTEIIKLSSQKVPYCLGIAVRRVFVYRCYVLGRSTSKEHYKTYMIGSNRLKDDLPRIKRYFNSWSSEFEFLRPHKKCKYKFRDIKRMAAALPESIRSRFIYQCYLCGSDPAQEDWASYQPNIFHALRNAKPYCKPEFYRIKDLADEIPESYGMKTRLQFFRRCYLEGKDPDTEDWRNYDLGKVSVHELAQPDSLPETEDPYSEFNLIFPHRDCRYTLRELKKKAEQIPESLGIGVRRQFVRQCYQFGMEDRASFKTIGVEPETSSSPNLPVDDHCIPKPKQNHKSPSPSKTPIPKQTDNKMQPGHSKDVTSGDQSVEQLVRMAQQIKSRISLISNLENYEKTLKGHSPLGSTSGQTTEELLSLAKRIESRLQFFSKLEKLPQMAQESKNRTTRGDSANFVDSKNYALHKAQNQAHCSGSESSFVGEYSSPKKSESQGTNVEGPASSRLAGNSKLNEPSISKNPKHSTKVVNKSVWRAMNQSVNKAVTKKTRKEYNSELRNSRSNPANSESGIPANQSGVNRPFKVPKRSAGLLKTPPPQIAGVQPFHPGVPPPPVIVPNNSVVVGNPVPLPLPAVDRPPGACMPPPTVNLTPGICVPPPSINGPPGACMPPPTVNVTPGICVPPPTVNIPPFDGMHQMPGHTMGFQPPNDGFLPNYPTSDGVPFNIPSNLVAGQYIVPPPAVCNPQWNPMQPPPGALPYAPSAGFLPVQPQYPSGPANFNRVPAMNIPSDSRMDPTQLPCPEPASSPTLKRKTAHEDPNPLKRPATVDRVGPKSEDIASPLYIVHSEHPNIRLSDEQMDAVENGILEAILEVNDHVKPTFKESTRSNGQYCIVCNDGFTRNWLFNFLQTHQPCPDTSLKISSEEPPNIRANAVLPLCRDDDNTILKFLGKQNAGLNTRRWEVIERWDSGDRKTCLNLMVDDDSAEVLEKCRQVNFKLGRGEIVIATKAIVSYEMRNGLAQDGFSGYPAAHPDIQFGERHRGPSGISRPSIDGVQYNSAYRGLSVGESSPAERKSLVGRGSAQSGDGDAIASIPKSSHWRFSPADSSSGVIESPHCSREPWQVNPSNTAFASGSNEPVFPEACGDLLQGAATDKFRKLVAAGFTRDKAFLFTQAYIRRQLVAQPTLAAPNFPTSSLDQHHSNASERYGKKEQSVRSDEHASESHPSEANEMLKWFQRK